MSFIDKLINTLFPFETIFKLFLELKNSKSLYSSIGILIDLIVNIITLILWLRVAYMILNIWGSFPGGTFSSFEVISKMA